MATYTIQPELGLPQFELLGFLGCQSCARVLKSYLHSLRYLSSIERNYHWLAGMLEVEAGIML